MAIRQFYFPASMCFDTVCRDVDIPWVSSFQQTSATDRICVLDTTVGEQVAGLYIFSDLNMWTLALSYEDMCSFLAGAVTVKIIVNAVTEQPQPISAVVFRSGYKMPDGSTVIAGSRAVWVVVTPILSGGSTVLTLQDMQGNLIGNFVTT